MARAPLLRSLQALFNDYRIAEARGLSVEHLGELRAEHRSQKRPASALDRRRFLAAAGAAGATLALPRFARAKPSNASVAIVGAGIAGLTCALKLADRGINATVYEASGRTGGRMFSHTGYWNDGQVSEWCGELIDTGHATMKKLITRFKLTKDDLLAAQPQAAEETYYFFGAHYPRSAALADFAPVYAAVSADLTAAGYPTFFDSFTAAGSVLDHMSIYDWIETRVAGGHTSPMGQLLDAAYAIEYGADTSDQSALNLIYLLGYQLTPNHFDLFGESDERFHIRGGNQLLTTAIADALGSQVQTGYSLAKIAQTAAGRYDLTFDVGTSTTTVTADYVVLAIPFAVLRTIDTSQAGFDTLKNQAIQDLGRGHNGKLQLQYTSRLWNQTGAWPGVSSGSTYADTGYQASWEVSRAQAGASGLLVLYSGGAVTDGMTTSSPFAPIGVSGVAADAAAGRAQIEPVFPGLDATWNGKATQSLPHKSPFFNASYSYYRVGQYTAFGGYEIASQQGVFFCGEHTSTDFQGYMEGGAETGKRIARAVAKEVQHFDDMNDEI